MPVQWTISHTKRLVIAVAKDKVTPGEIVDYFDGVTREGGMSYGKLFQIGKVQNTLTNENVEMLGSIIRGYVGKGIIGPVAIIAPDDHEYEQAQLFAKSASVNRPLIIFREWHLGRAWLDKVMEQLNAVSSNT